MWHPKHLIFRSKLPGRAHRFLFERQLLNYLLIKLTGGAYRIFWLRDIITGIQISTFSSLTELKQPLSSRETNLTVALTQAQYLRSVRVATKNFRKGLEFVTMGMQVFEITTRSLLGNLTETLNGILDNLKDSSTQSWGRYR
ncbi:hypothetical protein TNCV_371841 [Trichonephila clavipes]|nr:hypothetical protein TNCV_371841 [Trichonephila clavipes]